ncbi:unnamed protein product [Rotaria socialis]|uniref:GST C-terminal domain-containing protein n=1 Tax=Rotaria socialis TaxID=392032 RepID=A0A818N9I0_9BILA|nr:unnamed protein product [Rotaria socialis]
MAIAQVRNTSWSSTYTPTFLLVNFIWLAKIEAFADTATEVFNKFGSIIWYQEGSQTKASLDQFLVNELSKYLHNIDILAKAYSESGKFFVGNHLNFADLCVYDALESIVEADTNILNEYA